jgi:transcriptional antiterminator
VEADAQLETRLSLLHSSGQVDEDIVEFVRASTPALAEAGGLPPTDETYGSLITHTLLALQRVRAGEGLTAWDTDHSAELAAFPNAVVAAETFAERARQQLGVEVPAQEREFMALHLAAIQHGAA